MPRAPHRCCWPLLATLLLASPSWATFTDIGAGLPGLSTPAVAWGDFDGDGDIDLAVSGTTITGPITRVYKNVNGIFSDAAALPVSAACTDGSLAWGDFDGDTRIDLALTGDTGTGLITRVYRNNISGPFTDIGTTFEGVKGGAVTWADYDNDGDLDLAFGGTNAGGTGVAHLYRNTAGTFQEVAAGLVGLSNCSMAWADHDQDGDLDLMIAGGTGTSSVTNLYRNDGGTLTSVSSGVAGMGSGAISWGDFEPDGDPDLVICGNSNTRVYRNTAGSLTDIGAFIQPIYDGCVAWADYDNDADLDFALVGGTGSVYVAAIYQNNSGTFVQMNDGLPSVGGAALAWGDFDNDGDLDLVIAGGTPATGSITHIYRNDGVPPNTRPTPPTGLSMSFNTTSVTFRWEAGPDANNPAAALSYNLCVGTPNDSASVMAPNANLLNGYRQVVRLGNVGQRLTWTLARSAFPTGPIYWGVQAIDQGFEGSVFANGPAATLDVGDRVALPGFALRMRGPNPFTADARLGFSLPQASRVRLEVLDVAGRRVQTLLVGDRPAGEHEARWAGDDARGHPAAPGAYVVRLRVGEETASLRVLKIE